MEWKEVTSFFVVLLCRFILFLFIIVLSLVILGIPNVNTCFLTVSIFKIISSSKSCIYVASSLHESGYKADTQARHSSVVIWDFAQLRDHRKPNRFHGIIKQSVICNF